MEDEYNKQLIQECKKRNCLKIFCKKLEDPVVIKNISKFLGCYNDIFLCNNVTKLLYSNNFNEYINKGVWCLDLLFFYLNSFNESKSLSNSETYNQNTLIGITNSKKLCSKKKLKKQVLENLNKYSLNKFVNNIKIYNNKPHLFCNNVNKELDLYEQYLMCGVLELLFKKYEKKPNSFFGLVILKLFILISNYFSAEIQHYNIIYQILYQIYNNEFKNRKLSIYKNDCKENFNNTIAHIKDIEKRDQTFKDVNITINDCESSLDITNCRSKPFKIAEEETNFSHLCHLNQNTNFICLNTVNLYKNDLNMLIAKFSKCLNYIIDIDIRENKKLEVILNIFQLLYSFNSKMNVVSFEKFYCDDFCNNINLKEEFKFLRTKSKTVLNYSFILPLNLKAELIKLENNDLMKASLQDSFFRSIFEGHVEPYLFITITRENIYSDSLKILNYIKQEDVHKQLRITFKNEEGVDSGGIRKEFFQLLSQIIKNDANLFNIYKNIIWFKNIRSLDSYYCIGKLLGIALYNNVILNLPFPSFFFKKLLNKKTTFSDLKEIDLELYNSLNNMKKLNEKEIDDLELTFTISYKIDEKIITHNLNENNVEVKVTKQNLHLFINKYADYILNKLLNKQFDSIKEGFYYVIRRDILVYLDAKELEKIIIGSNEFDINEIKSTTIYNGYLVNSDIIKWFWEIFEAYSKKMKKKLLQFITGNDRIPISGSASLNLVIMKNGCDTDRLPSSQTCFNTLLLPEYSSKDKLQKKMRTALELTAGFFLL